MQLAQVKHNNVTTNAARQQSFSVAQTAEMFSLLSANVYTDPVKAVIREIICNAMDAHTKAGKADEQVEVHLPTQYEPWFSVKDNGPGMSDYDVYNIFCVYGASTKTNNNDETGGFGIGAKAPFAVTDQFTVNVRHNGKYTIYSAYKNDNGVPQMSILSISDTDECNGVEVHVPIGDHRDNVFKYKYIECLRAFKVQPKLNTPINVEQHYCEFDLGDDVIGKVDLNGAYYSRNKYTIHMGNVEYKGDMVTDSPASYIFDVPVGTFMPSANRENLQSKDLSVINSYVEKLQEQIKLHLENQVKEASSIVEATKIIANSAVDKFLFNSLEADAVVVFNGAEITDLDYLTVKMRHIKEAMPSQLWQEYEQSALTGNRDSMKEFTVYTGETRTDWSFAKPKEVFDGGKVLSFSASQLVNSRDDSSIYQYDYNRKHILIKNHDMSTQNRRGLYQRIKYFLSVEYPGADTCRDFKVHYMDGSDDLERNKNFYAYIFPVVEDIFDKVIDLKDLPEVPKEVKQREVRPARKLKPYGVSFRENKRYDDGTIEYTADISISYREVEVDLEDGGYYIPVSRRQMSDGDMQKIILGMSLKGSNQRCGANMVNKNRKIVAVPKTILKEFENHPKWFNYADKCEQEFNLALGKIGLQQSLLDNLKQSAYTYNEVISLCLSSYPLGIHAVNTLNNKDAVFDLVSMISIILNKAGFITDFEKVFARCNKISKKLQEVLSIEEFKRVLNCYPNNLTPNAKNAFYKRVGYKDMDHYVVRKSVRKATEEFCNTRPGLMNVIADVHQYDEKSVIAYAKALDIPLKKGYNTNSTNGKD